MSIIHRKLFPAIYEHLQAKEITLITGPRQAGKTTLMKQLEENVKNKGAKTLFLDLDQEQDRPFFESQSRLIQKIQYEIGDEKGYVFIDEIQRKEDAGLFLKGLYDSELPYKFIVTGSGSLELKEKIHESLAGRKRIFELSTLSFEEFVNFKTGYKDKDMDFFDLFKERGREHLEEYLNFGGYPRVVLEAEMLAKRAAIDEIYRSYLERDIAILLKIQKTESLTQLVRILASQSGNLVNIAELSNTLGIAVKTVKNYLWYLEKTFIVERVTPYFRNIRKEITKSSTYYFVDLGLKNYATNQFGNALNTPSAGLLFENFVYKGLKEQIARSAITIHFWRSKDKAEVDFVIDTGIKAIPIEVKYSILKEPKTTRSFQSFLTKYKPKDAYITHLGKYMKKKSEQTTIHFLPFYSLQTIFKDL